MAEYIFWYVAGACTIAFCIGQLSKEPFESDQAFHLVIICLLWPVTISMMMGCAARRKK